MTEIKPKDWEEEFDREFGVVLGAIKITVRNYRDIEGANNLTKMYQKLPTEIKDFIRKVRTDAVLEERKRIEEDMKAKMYHWHGTGINMVEDYFKNNQ